MPRLAPLRDILADALHLDRDSLTPGQGLRVTIGVVTALGIAAASASLAAGAAAAGGSLGAGMASIDAEGRPRVGRVAATCVGMAAATFIGSATGPYTWLHVLAAAAWAAPLGLLSAVEPMAIPIALNSIVAFLVFGRFGASPGDAIRTAAFVAAGGAIQLVLHILLRRPPQLRREVARLAAAYRALATYAASIPAGGTSFGAASALDAARTAIQTSPVQGVAREAWETLIDEGWRIRLQLLAIAQGRLRLTTIDGSAPLRYTLDRFLEATSTALNAIAAALSTAIQAHELDDAMRRFDAAVEQLQEASVEGDDVAAEADTIAAIWHQIVPAAEAIGGQLRAAAAIVGPAVAGTRLSRLDPRGRVAQARWSGVEGAGALAARVRGNLTLRSAAMRHGIRLAAVVVVALLVAPALGLDRGYWIGLTSVLVLRPEYSLTRTRGVARAIGTLLGVGIASLVAITLHPNGLALGLVIGLFTWLSASLLVAGYFAFSVAITGAVVFLLATVDPSPVNDGEQRLLATLIGCALAFIAYRSWPSWGRSRAREALAELANATRAYVGTVLVVAADPRSPARPELPALDRRLRLARTNAEAAIAQSLGDPPARRIDPDWSRGVLAAIRREGLAAHALRARIVSDPDWPATPDVARLAAAVDAALSAAAEAIATGEAPAIPESLRAVHRDLARRLTHDGSRTEAHASLLDETDEMVDAANTLLHLLGAGSAQPATADARTASPSPGPTFGR